MKRMELVLIIYIIIAIRLMNFLMFFSHAESSINVSSFNDKFDIIAPIYDFASEAYEGIVCVKMLDNEFVIYFDSKGNELFRINGYQEVGNFSEGLAPVGKFDLDDKCFRYGYINRKGQEVIPVKYSFADPFTNGKAKVSFEAKESERKYFSIDKKNLGLEDTKINARQPNTSKNISTDDLVPGKLNDKWGYADSKGNIKIAPQWEKAEKFYEGYAVVTNIKMGINDAGNAVAQEESSGLIDSQGNYVIDKGKFKSIGSFKCGVALIRDLNGKFGFLLNKNYTPEENYVLVSRSSSSKIANSNLVDMWVEPTSVKPGEKIIASFYYRNAGTKAWIGFFGEEGNNQSFFSFAYLKDLSGNFSLSAPEKAGKYNFRIFADNGFNLMYTSNAIEVKDDLPPNPLIAYQVPPMLGLEKNILNNVDRSDEDGINFKPDNPVTFKLLSPTMITFIRTFHYALKNNPAYPVESNNDLKPILLKNQDDGTVYGPWKISGGDININGNNIPCAYRDVYPNIVVKVGQYEVIDSNQESWAYDKTSSDSGGFTLVRGFPTDGSAQGPGIFDNGSPMPQPGTDANGMKLSKDGNSKEGNSKDGDVSSNTYNSDFTSLESIMYYAVLAITAFLLLVLIKMFIYTKF